MQFGLDWKFRSYPGEDDLVPASFAKRENLALKYLEVMRERTNADFALWWGPKDKGFYGYDFNFLKTYDAEHYSMADFACQHSSFETMVGSVPGNELRDIYRRWIATEEIISYPPVKTASIDPARTYSLCVPMDLVAKLGNRRKVLRDVQFGAYIELAPIP